MPTSFARKSRHRHYPHGRAFFGAIILLASIAGVSAQTVITSEWNTSSGNWNVPGNWAPADVPDNDDQLGKDYDVLIGNRAIAANAIVTLVLEDEPLDAVNNLTLSNGADLFTNGRFLFVNGQTIISNSSTLLRVSPHAGDTTAFRSGTIVVNSGGGVGMEGGLLEVATSMTINAGGTLAGFGTANFGNANDNVLDSSLNNSGAIRVGGGINPVLILQRTGTDRLDLDGTSETGIVDVANSLPDAGNDTLTLVINSPFFDPFGGTIQVGQRDTITFNNSFSMSGAQVDMDGDGFTATMNGTGDIFSMLDCTFNLEEDVVIDNGLTFTSGNTINLNRASLRMPFGHPLSLHGALNVLAAGGVESSISLKTNFFLTFNSDSVTTLNDNLLVQSNNCVVEEGATFSGVGTLRIGGHPLGSSTAPSSISAEHLSNINVPVRNEGIFFVGGIGAVGRSDVKEFRQTSSGDMRVELHGTALDQYDRLVVSGEARLGGGITVTAQGFTLAAGQTFDIITAAGGVIGSPGSVAFIGLPLDLSFRVDFPPKMLRLTIVGPSSSPTPTASPSATPTATATATPTATPPTVLGNISTRLRVETGNNVLIGGFIITGAQPKKVIARAIGPSLSQFFAGTLANPTLELRDQLGGLIAANDDWKNQPDADRQAVIDSTVAPTNDLESALVRTLPANGANYTVIVSGANNGTGIGVVEVFDLDQSVDSKLANISTRGFVQADPDILIAGTIIVGSQAQKVLIRAIGPSLSQFFAGTLANPTLELRDQNGGLIAANDDWKNQPDADRQAVIDTTIPPTNDLESAIVRTLPANNAQYTAIVRGVNGGTGIAVVEVYALD